MLAIYKRELKSFFTTYTGYIFITFIVMATGIYSWFVNFKNQSPNFEYVVYNLNFLFLIAVPVITMKSFAEEHRQKTDKLLYLLPISSKAIVVGKYLATVTVLLISCAVIGLIPLILNMFGDISLLTCYCTIFGFFLLGCALISIGIFISSLCENLVVSSVVTFLLMLICYLSSTVASVISTSSVFTSVIGAFALFDRLVMFVMGIFDLTAVLYYLSVSAIFLILTVFFVNKRRVG